MADSLRYIQQMVRLVPFCNLRDQQMVRLVVYCDPTEMPHTRFVPYTNEKNGRQIWWNPVSEEAVDPTEREFSYIRFMWNNLWDLADTTLTASTEQTDFEVGRTQQRWSHWTWRSLACGEQWLKADLGSAKDVQSLILWNHWWNPGSTVRIQGNDADAWGAPAIDVTLDIPSSQYSITHTWNTIQTYQWWRIYVPAGVVSEDTDNRGDKDDAEYCHPYYKIGRIFLGEYFSPSVNFNRKFVLGLKDESKKEVAISGAMTSTLVPEYELVQYDFQFLTAADIVSFTEMFDAVGRKTPIFVVENEKYWWRRTYYTTLFNDFGVDSEGDNLFQLSTIIEGMR